MRFLSAAETARLVDWRAAIACMRNAYAQPVAPQAVPGRLIAANGPEWLRLLPALPAASRYMGAKQISRTREGKLVYLITLFDRTTGELAWLIDGLVLTAMRTAATSIAALEMLTRSEAPIDLAILGSGLEATEHLAALAASRSGHAIRRLRVFSPTPANRDRFAARAASQHGLEAQAVDTAQAAVVGATHVLATARSRGEQPILFGEWLSTEAVVVSVGSTIPIQREIDPSVVERAQLIVADVPEELATQTGDMIAATRAGIAFDAKLFSLADLAEDRIPATLLDASGVRLFKSVGSALQDIAIAELAVEQAEAAGAGLDTGITLELKQSIGRNTNT